MAELLTIARPYAEAAFGIAKSAQDQAKALQGWSDALGRLSTVLQTPEASRLMSDPMVKAKTASNRLSRSPSTAAASRSPC